MYAHSIREEEFIERKQDWKTKWMTLKKKGEGKMNEVFADQLASQTTIVSMCMTEEEQETQ